MRSSLYPVVPGNFIPAAALTTRFTAMMHIAIQKIPPNRFNNKAREYLPSPHLKRCVGFHLAVDNQDIYSQTLSRLSGLLYCVDNWFTWPIERSVDQAGELMRFPHLPEQSTQELLLWCIFAHHLNACCSVHMDNCRNTITPIWIDDDITQHEVRQGRPGCAREQVFCKVL